MTAADSVNDYSPGRITEIAAVFAASAGVSTSAVQVTVTAASVRITTTIIVASAEDAAALNANLTATLATPESATSFLSSVSGGVTVVSAPVVQAVSEEVVAYPPPPSAPAPLAPPPLPLSPVMPGGFALAASGDANNAVIIAVPTAIVGVAILAVAGFRWFTAQQTIKADLFTVKVRSPASASAASALAAATAGGMPSITTESSAASAAEPVLMTRPSFRRAIPPRPPGAAAMTPGPRFERC